MICSVTGNQKGGADLIASGHHGQRQSENIPFYTSTVKSINNGG